MLFVSSESLPLVVEFNQDTAQKISGDQVPTCSPPERQGRVHTPTMWP